MQWRLTALVAGVAALVVAALVCYLLLPPRQSTDVTVPAQQATPEEVVTAYLAALNAHDCNAAVSMTTTENSKDSTRSWCRDVASLAGVAVGKHFVERPAWSGHSGSVEVANVPVEFNLKWRPLHSDGSMDEGATTWGYLLARTSADAPWRIVDQGTG
jgi:hypothetical protein